MDELMALDWLQACRDGHLFETDVFYRVLELTQTDLDPDRGWRLVKRLIELARDERELWQIGADPLSTIVRNHEDVVGAELESMFRSNPKCRRVFRGQISGALYDFSKNRKLDPLADTDGR